nr:anti-phage dCTP deaminase [Amylibacter sp.]
MQNPVSDLLDVSSHTSSVATDISDRLSQELIIALVGPVGSGVSSAAGYIADILDSTFKYEVAPILKASDIIKAEAYRVGISLPPSLPFDAYITSMQDAGNKLRERFGNNYLTEKLVEKIRIERKDRGGYAEDVPLPGRRAYIIDSLKNIEELNLLRAIYGETLCVFGVFAPDSLRKQRLKDAGVQPGEIDKIISRDQGELPTFGQKTRKLFVKSDFFVCNDRRQDDLRNRIERFLNIVFDISVHTPTREESAMYEANSAAANSACMSRQVGAAIVSSRGELISVGWNDVPSFGGGLYTEDDRAVYDGVQRKIIDSDKRCYNWGGSICHNETRRVDIIQNIVSKISGAGVLKRGKTRDDIEQLLVGTAVDSLTEFSRSIHAEMEAILSVAREGKHSLVGATLYTNTYPCHNCARHIVAAGITKVVYIEPYLKSLATTLHEDAISEDPEAENMVIFRQYDGVAPTSYLKLFRPKDERKANGRLKLQNPATALPIFRIPLDAQRDYEDKILADLAEKEQST